MIKRAMGLVLLLAAMISLEISRRVFEAYVLLLILWWLGL